MMRIWPSISDDGAYNGRVKVTDIGEFGLIRRLRSYTGLEPPADLVVGIGDDCAVWRAGDQCLLATTDTLVEGVHFIPDVAPWTDIGWKVLAINVSDIAAMGGEPLFALVTLALPGETSVDSIDALYAGLGECATEYGVTVAGGDIVSAPQVAVTVALIGRAQMRDGIPLLMRRDGARAGDVIAVTGTLGDSAAGLRRLREGTPAADALVRAHLRPRTPLALAQEAARLGVCCAIDVSDGLVQDIGHTCEMSRLGADVSAADIPISPALRSAYPEEALALACGGGEDYELVLVGEEHRITELSDANPGALTVIGRMTERHSGRVRLLDSGGAEIDVDTRGWDHLRHDP